MEIIMTVLITLLVVALIVAGINLVRLNKKAQECDMLQLEVIDLQNRIDKQIEDFSKEQQDQFKDVWMRTDELSKDYRDRIEKWVASTDRRFDVAYNDIRKLDQVVNPNKDLLKK